MISIRTGLVVAAFVATGLTAAAEQFADRMKDGADPFQTVGIEEAMPAKGLRLARKLPATTVEPDLSPWI